jgi:hypothetical protein
MIMIVIDSRASAAAEHISNLLEHLLSIWHCNRYDYDCLLKNPAQPQSTPSYRQIERLCYISPGPCQQQRSVHTAAGGQLLL